MSIRQAKGTTGVYDVTLRHETNVPLTYTGSETLAATVWPGDARAELFAPAVVWVTAPNKVRVTVTSANLSAVDPGTYRIRVLCGNPASNVAETDLIVEPAPGSGTAPLCYCTAEDLKTICPQIEQHKAADDRAGFEEQRAAATEWFQDLIRSRVHGDRTQLDAWLTAGKLIVTKRIALSVAYKAVSLVFTGRLAAKGETDFSAMGRQFELLANSSAATARAGIDTDGDGTADVVINLGMAKVNYL